MLAIMLPFRIKADVSYHEKSFGARTPMELSIIVSIGLDPEGKHDS
jgi:hypothetical protein